MLAEESHAPLSSLSAQLASSSSPSQFERSDDGPSSKKAHTQLILPTLQPPTALTLACHLPAALALSVGL